MPIDQALERLNNFDQEREEREAARELRQQKAAGGDELQEQRGMSLRERLAMSRMKERAKEKVKEAVEDKVKKLGVNQGINYLWGALVFSWGLTLLPLNFLVFKRLLLGDKKSARLVDVMGVLAIDALIFSAFFGLIAIIVWVADNVLINAGMVVWQIGTTIGNWLWNGSEWTTIAP